MNQAQDQRFFRNYSLIIGVLVVMVLVFIVMASMLGTDEAADVEQRAAVVAELTAPVGQVRITGQTPPAAEPESPAPVTAVAATEPAAAGSRENIAAEGSTVSAEETGRRVFNSLCFTCHGSVDGKGGLPNIPHFGDKAAWADRIAQGKPLLYERALKGFTGASGIPMAPKGGNPNLTDEEVKAAVDFIVANSQ